MLIVILRAVIVKQMISWCSLRLQHDLVKHLVHLGVVLVELVEQLAGKLQLVGFLVVSTPHQDFEPLLLQFGEVELSHFDEHDCFAAFDLSLNVGGVVDNLFEFYLELLALEFCLYLLERTQLVGVVDIDEVRLDVMRDGFVVFGFPEGGLTCPPVQVVPPRFNQIDHSLFYQIIQPNSLQTATYLKRGLFIISSVFIIEKYIYSMTAKRLLNPQGSRLGQEEFGGSANKGIVFSSPGSPRKSTLVRINVRNSNQLHPSRKPDIQAATSNRVATNLWSQRSQMVDSEEQYIKHLKTVLTALEETHALSVVLRDKNRRRYHQSLSSIRKVRDRLQRRQQDLLQEFQQLELLIDAKPIRSVQ